VVGLAAILSDYSATSGGKTSVERPIDTLLNQRHQGARQRGTFPSGGEERIRMGPAATGVGRSSSSSSLELVGEEPEPFESSSSENNWLGDFVVKYLLNGDDQPSLLTKYAMGIGFTVFSQIFAAGQMVVEEVYVKSFPPAQVFFFFDIQNFQSFAQVFF